MNIQYTYRKLIGEKRVKKELFCDFFFVILPHNDIFDIMPFSKLYVLYLNKILRNQT